MSRVRRPRGRRKRARASATPSSLEQSSKTMATTTTTKTTTKRPEARRIKWVARLWRLAPIFGAALLLVSSCCKLGANSVEAAASRESRATKVEGLRRSTVGLTEADGWPRLASQQLRSSARDKRRVIGDSTLSDSGMAHEWRFHLRRPSATPASNKNRFEKNKKRAKLATRRRARRNAQATSASGAEAHTKRRQIGLTKEQGAPESQEPTQPSHSKQLDSPLNSSEAAANDEGFQRRVEELKQKYTTNRAISDEAYYALLFIYSALILVGAVSNSLICLTVMLKPKILSPRNIFIVNLAGSDLLLCVFTMPFSFIEISMKMWQMGLLTCKLIAGLQATSIFVSTISITAIAIDRYKVIVYPTHQEAASGTRCAAIILVLVWLGSLALSTPLFLYRTVKRVELSKHYGSIKSIDYCYEDWPFSHGRGIYSVVSMMVQYVAPITIVSVVYAKISDKLQKRLIRRQRLTQLECQQKRQLNLIRRTHTMLISVSLVFGLSWLPLNLLNVISDFSDFLASDERVFRVVFAICHLIGCSSACSNPILYGYLNENFRKEFRQVYLHHMHKWARLCRRICLKSCSGDAADDDDDEEEPDDDDERLAIRSGVHDNDDRDDDFDDEELDEEEEEDYDYNDDDEANQDSSDSAHSEQVAKGPLSDEPPSYDQASAKQLSSFPLQRLSSLRTKRIERDATKADAGNQPSQKGSASSGKRQPQRSSICALELEPPSTTTDSQLKAHFGHHLHEHTTEEMPSDELASSRRPSYQTITSSRQTLGLTMRFCLCVSASTSSDSLAASRRHSLKACGPLRAQANSNSAAAAAPNGIQLRIKGASSKAGAANRAQLWRCQCECHLPSTCASGQKKATALSASAGFKRSRGGSNGSLGGERANLATTPLGARRKSSAAPNKMRALLLTSGGDFQQTRAASCAAAAQRQGRRVWLRFFPARRLAAKQTTSSREEESSAQRRLSGGQQSVSGSQRPTELELARTGSRKRGQQQQQQSGDQVSTPMSSVGQQVAAKVASRQTRVHCENCKEAAEEHRRLRQRQLRRRRRRRQRNKTQEASASQQRATKCGAGCQVQGLRIDLTSGQTSGAKKGSTLATAGAVIEPGACYLSVESARSSWRAHRAGRTSFDASSERSTEVVLLNGAEPKRDAELKPRSNEQQAEQQDAGLQLIETGEVAASAANEAGCIRVVNDCGQCARKGALNGSALTAGSRKSAERRLANASYDDGRQANDRQLTSGHCCCCSSSLEAPMKTEACQAAKVAAGSILTSNPAASQQQQQPSLSWAASDSNSSSCCGCLISHSSSCTCSASLHSLASSYNAVHAHSHPSQTATPSPASGAQPEPPAAPLGASKQPAVQEEEEQLPAARRNRLAGVATNTSSNCAGSPCSSCASRSSSFSCSSASSTPPAHSAPASVRASDAADLKPQKRHHSLKDEATHSRVAGGVPIEASDVHLSVPDESVRRVESHALASFQAQPPEGAAQNAKCADEQQQTNSASQPPGGARLAAQN